MRCRGCIYAAGSAGAACASLETKRFSAAAKADPRRICKDAGQLFLMLAVLCAGALAGRELAQQLKRNAALEQTAHSMQHLLEKQCSYYPLLEERVEQAKIARHDLRHHLLTISALVESGRYEGLKDYLSSYRQRVESGGELQHSENKIADIIAHHYVSHAAALGIDLTLRLGIAAELEVAPADLCAVLSNLLENAVEACLRLRERSFITLIARMKGTALTMCMENSSAEIRTGGSGFLSLKRENEGGYGLESIRAIARRYHGTADFYYNSQTRVFVSRVTMQAGRWKKDGAASTCQGGGAQFRF